MTKSTITRERLEQLADNNTICKVSWDERIELAQIALAAMDSEPVALQPELAKVIYHFRDWNEGFPVERFKADYVISWMLANYPPAQPAPVVSAELLHTAASAIEDLLTTKDRTGACVWFDLPFRLRSAANAHSAPVVPDDVSIFEAAIEECKTCDSIDEHAWNHGVLVVMAKYESCRAAMLAAATQSPGSEPATVPGKWIPVSERLPEDSGRYWCYVEEQNDLGKSHYQWNCSWNGDRWWVESEGGGIVTHWMPLPAAPQEVNRE
ncbi:DUF551 domain-containing protein [Klebsiella pneumoniae]|uniref:DUF551 domain-containing protein n=1 Tax=Klebsiella pneumoniae TaxID=573 RepID=UPI001D0EA25A|nr:DUF551 domain-containing protein [Klebsiella pneumoniae]MDS0457942.1 DUF551 domain-containing protein [Klebsiella pneumoniae]MDS0508267.1 DUF551 domain-containing protein [Klebsiella pneumoniae]